MSDSFAKKFNNKRRRKNMKGRGLNKKQLVQVKQMIQAPAEKKFYDYSFDQLAISITPQYFDMLQPAQGTGKSDIIGTKLLLHSIYFNFYFVYGDAINYVRMILLQWYPDTSVDDVSWKKVLEYPGTSSPINIDEFMSPLVLSRGNERQFRVLKDIQICLNDNDNRQQLVTGYINKGFRKDIYVEDTAQNGGNHIQMILISDSGTIVHPSISGHVRFRFTDE